MVAGVAEAAQSVHDQSMHDRVEEKRLFRIGSGKRIFFHFSDIELTLDQLGINSGWIWDGFGIDLGSTWHRLGIDLGSILV